jgi:hypothetical protein
MAARGACAAAGDAGGRLGLVPPMLLALADEVIE